ncbi:hypothetical protein QFC21_002823 [Naganishia friedmannii]|uniref:Uncharacterized protein n=1 Tax=Naganishia friedmannii TaxID=89922 RepID=A0ACC2VTH9_9TREE|nr:hypothetical protein QFC21_002823 [Naganishia friedmannii]
MSAPTSALPVLPHIGQPDYIPLLIKALQARHATNEFDSRIFLGILLVLIAGEKNLIVDVDVHSLIENYRDTLSTLPPFEDGGFNAETHARLMTQQVKIKIGQAEERVRHMVEFITGSIFGLASRSARVSTRGTTQELFGACEPSGEGHQRPPDSRSALQRDPAGLIMSTNLKEDQTSSDVTKKATEDNGSETTIPPVLILTKMHKGGTQLQAQIWETLNKRNIVWSHSGVTGRRDADASVPTRVDDSIEYSRDLPTGFFLVWIRLSVDKEKYVSPCLVRLSFLHFDLDPQLTNGQLPTLSSLFLSSLSFMHIYRVHGQEQMDQFALSCSVNMRKAAYTDDFHARSKKSRVVIDPVLDSEYIWVLRRLSNKTHMHPPLRLQVSDIVSSLISCTGVSTEVTSSSILDFKTFIRISRILFQPFAWKAELLNPDVNGRQYDQRRKLQEALDREEWYATAEDIARVWTNVFRHRTKLDQNSEQCLFALTGGTCVKPSTHLVPSPQNNVGDPIRDSLGTLEYKSLHASRLKPVDDVVPALFERVIARCAAESAV